MPFRTEHGSHYHETYGCHGATIPCGTEGLAPCSDCCGERGHAPGGSVTAGAAPSASHIGNGERTLTAGGMGGIPMPDESLCPEISPAEAASLTTMGIDGLADGQAMPEGEPNWDILFSAAFGMAPSEGRELAVETPSQRIRGLLDVLPDNRYDDSILVLSELAEGRMPSDRREVERAISDGAEVASVLLRMAKGEQDEARRRRLLLAVGAVANDGVLKGTLSSLAGFPAGWHQTHALSVACNHHDMFYMTQALVDRSERRRMSIEDFEEGVMPLLGTLSEFARTRFTKFPRVVTAPQRLPDGPDGDRAWGTQTSILVTRDDVDDSAVLSLMDRDDVQGKAKDDTYHRGVPGYWQVGMDPKAERDSRIRMVNWMSSHTAGWSWLRKRQAIRDFDENMMPILEWLSDDATSRRLMNEESVEATDLI